jgi:hypothetical protein
MLVAASANPAEAARQPQFLRESFESPRGWRLAHDQQSEGELQNLLRDYFRLVEGMDEAVGLADDPLETRNLSQDPAAAPDMETMRRKLDRQRIELGPHRAWERPSGK